MDNILLRRGVPTKVQKSLRVLLCVAGLVLLFTFYTWGISQNPRGFYLDESATAYNAYLVSRTGAGEFGPRFPLLFQQFAVSNATYMNPLAIYLMAIVFRLVPPSISVARMSAAFWMFGACLLLGVLAKRISRDSKIGIIVAATALLTPWLFELGRLVFDAHLSAFTVVVFLLAAHRIQSKETWDWRDIAMVAGALSLVTYGYFAGRALAPLFALGLLLLATTRRRFLGVLKIWLAYGLTLVPLVLFDRSHPGVVTKRLHEVSYIRPGVPWKETAYEFVRRYLEDQSLTALLLTGDYHPRHHVQGSGGAIFFATFILAMLGLALIIVRRWREPWWRFVIYGLAVSILPGAITNEPFHEVRLMAYPVFLIVLTIPALEWLLATNAGSSLTNGRDPDSSGSRLQRAFHDTAHTAVAPHQSAVSFSCVIRLSFLGILLVATVAQAVDFQMTFWREGQKRVNEFDVPYKAAYDAAVAQPERPIYLENGQWGPAYMDAFWYATVEGRPISEFVRLPAGTRPPSGAIVLSSNSECQNCQAIQKSGCYLLYRAK
jgi:4-amino-4-deoxy-L-arabinose transferase-like glycosyltransferase